MECFNIIFETKCFVELPAKLSLGVRNVTTTSVVAVIDMSDVIEIAIVEWKR